jgi:hypothetical protein
MILHVREARYVRHYVLWLRFNDGDEGEIDLESELDGEVFAPLKDLSRFRRFRVDPELQTVVWENGADIAPEFLQDKRARQEGTRQEGTQLFFGDKRGHSLSLVPLLDSDLGDLVISWSCFVSVDRLR